MRITADTNILARAVARDDPRQTPLAQRALATADIVVITVPSLCELGWVLGRGYRYAPAEILEVIRLLVGGDNVVVDEPTVDAGLAMLERGGDFADGVIAFDGARKGGETFLSFDRRAVQLLAAQGRRAQLLA